jgi:hypothetical protein
MNLIYFDRATCEYFGVPYFDGYRWSCAKDAYKRVMGHKLDDAHMATLGNHRSIMTLERAESDAPGWYDIISSHI